MSPRKKVAIATWNDTGDPSIFGKQEFELEKLDAFLDKYNAENPDKKLNYTHIALKAMGYATGQTKKTMGKISFGNYLPAPSIDLSVFVDFNEKSMINVLVEDCKNQSISQIANQMQEKLVEIRKTKKEEIQETLNFLDRMPTFLISLIITIASFISYNIGISIPMLGLKKNHFGYGIVANVADHGIQDLTIPLANFARTVFVATVNAPYEKPVVVDDKLVVKKVINFTITFDHRFADGSDAVAMLKDIEMVWNNPEKFV